MSTPKIRKECVLLRKLAGSDVTMTHYIVIAMGRLVSRYHLKSKLQAAFQELHPLSYPRGISREPKANPCHIRHV